MFLAKGRMPDSGGLDFNYSGKNLEVWVLGEGVNSCRNTAKSPTFPMVKRIISRLQCESSAFSALALKKFPFPIFKDKDKPKG